MTPVIVENHHTQGEPHTMTIKHHYTPSGYGDSERNDMERIASAATQPLANEIVVALDYLALDADQGDGK